MLSRRFNGLATDFVRCVATRGATGLALAVLGALLLGAGCSEGVTSKLEEPIDAPSPKHPAMGSAVTGASAPHDHGAAPSGGSLPAGHPPIGATPPPAPQQPAAPSPGVGESAGADAGASVDATGRMSAGGVSFEIPEGWVNVRPSSRMRLAQFNLPRADGDSEDGLVTVSKFGGGVEGNIDRWRGQFVENPQTPAQTLEVGGMRVMVVHLEGTFAGMSGPFAGGDAPKTGQALLGAVVEIPGDALQVFFKGTGPKATIDRWKASFDDLVSSLRRE